jgi:hypothetical protein
MKETLKDLGEIEFVHQAKKLLDASADAADAYSHKSYTEERMRNSKLTLGFLNALIKGWNSRVGYYKLTGLSEKLGTVKDHYAKK